MRRSDLDQDPGPEHLRLVFPARVEELAPARSAVREFGERIGLSRDESFAIELATSEAVGNSMRHAYPDGRPGPIEVRMRESEGGVVVSVTDVGRGLRRLGRRRARGFGMAFINRLAARVELRRTVGGGSEIRMLFTRSKRTGN